MQRYHEDTIAPPYADELRFEGDDPTQGADLSVRIEENQLGFAIGAYFSDHASTSCTPRTLHLLDRREGPATIETRNQLY